jgi:hypothetical protein
LIDFMFARRSLICTIYGESRGFKSGLMHASTNFVSARAIPPGSRPFDGSRFAVDTNILFSAAYVARGVWETSERLLHPESRIDIDRIGHPHHVKAFQRGARTW